MILCSGKIYYELEQRREKLQRNDVAILRVEQLYPLPQKMLGSFLSGYPEEHADTLGSGRARKHGRLALSQGHLWRKTV